MMLPFEILIIVISCQLAAIQISPLLRLSAFDTADGQSGYERFLEKEKDDHNRNNCQHSRPWSGDPETEDRMR